MQQVTLAPPAELQRYSKKTRREQFLEEMDAVNLNLAGKGIRITTGTIVDAEQKRKNRTNARVRSKVEWPFRILKRVVGFTRARYGGLKKNHEWLCASFAAVNIYQHRRRLAKVTYRWPPRGRSAFARAR